MLIQFFYLMLIRYVKLAYLAIIMDYACSKTRLIFMSICFVSFFIW